MKQQYKPFNARIEGRRYVGEKSGIVSEIYPADQFGEQLPRVCGDIEAADIRRRVRNIRARKVRGMRDEAMRSCGLVKVRGALGGTYWE